MSDLLPIFAFIALCVIYGTSYAFVSTIIGSMNDAALSCMRMFCSSCATFSYFLYRIIFEPNYKQKVRESVRTGTTPIGKAFFCGIFSLGIPVTCITIAQRSVPSTVVTLSQPVIPLVTMVIAHFLLADEKISSQKLILSLFDLLGAVLTIIPTFSSSSSNDSKPSLLLDYLLLMISILCFGAGSVYLKVFLCQAELTVSCLCSTLGATAYTIISSMIRVGPITLFHYIMETPAKLKFYTMLLGIIYSSIPTFLFMFIVRTLGAVKANLTDFGQIVIGTFAGVVFLDEMKGYSLTDKLMSWAGVLLIVAALLIEFYLDYRHEKESKLQDQETLIKGEENW
ncbi:Integral membrane protein [Tritrichomonas foetus]|uniref:Integral membrane protein n=1 Tax=Tritrichomonas foetus TaxID=1144522 RepID=A0A1J4JH37_9EUKA|nr:Integral membrane protein [Tritrichomonas foetus]|eukprot:OHS98454.1 Integral membrane protein [Tritrichomonas foetus]